MSNSPTVDMFYKMWQEGERDPEVFLAAGQAKNELTRMFHVERYLDQFKKGMNPDNVKREVV